MVFRFLTLFWTRFAYPWSLSLILPSLQQHLIVFNYPSTEAEPSFTQVTAQNMTHKFYEPPCVSHTCVQPPFLTVSNLSGRCPCPWQGPDAQNRDRLFLVSVCWLPLYQESGHCTGDLNFKSQDSMWIELWNDLSFFVVFYLRRSSEMTKLKRFGNPYAQFFLC